jgi:L-alanine-DL-glutamate epimerase-like enolase superfamily enzyme
VAVVRAVKDAAADRIQLLVDANQNNAADGYPFWSRRTALKVARALDELGVYFLEEPLPRSDVEGLAEIASAVDMFIAGGEHTPTVRDFREHLRRGAFDIVQPDVVLGGNYGISGLRQVAVLADAFDRLIVPHVSSAQNVPLCVAASLHAMASVDNCPLVEYSYDPPILVPETTQVWATQPLVIDADGCIPLPKRPGLGVELDESQLVADGQ